MYDITIICSNYNSEKYIQQYLECINDQTHKDFDIIFVDANSTDDSLSLIKKFVFRQGVSKLVIECDKKIGIYEAWNLAIKNAETKYVMNYNTDDILHKACIEMYIKAIMDYPNTDVFYSSCHVVSDINHTNKINTYYQPNYSHEELLKRCFCGPFPCVKRQSIIDAGWFDQKFSIAGDYEMWLRMSKKGYKFYNVAYILGSYYENPHGISTNPQNKVEITRQVNTIRNLYR